MHKIDDTVALPPARTASRSAETPPDTRGPQGSGADPAGSATAAPDEFFNVLTHGVGTVVALVAGSVLVAMSLLHGDGWQLAGAIVFSLSMVLLYLSSTLYHAATDATHKVRLKICDHCAIYLLIAGTYTPFTLVGLRGPWGLGLFIAIWALAIAGIVFKLYFTGRFKRLSTMIYIAMGWLVLVAIKPLLGALDAWTLGWLLAGGLSYTLGTVFYHRPSLRHSHAIWHLFVIGGSACHYVAVWSQVT